MCRCNPMSRTPFCGKPGCETPPQVEPSRVDDAPPTTWHGTIALFHQLWGDASAGRYDKQKWARLHEALEMRAGIRGVSV